MRAIVKRPRVERIAVDANRADLGETHPEYAASLYNLAAIHQMRGEFDAAEPLHRDALAIRETTLGPDHPDVADSLMAIGALHRDRDQPDAAEAAMPKPNRCNARRWTCSNNSPAPATRSSRKPWTTWRRSSRRKTKRRRP